MSQQQPQRSQASPIKYGDVFPVSRADVARAEREDLVGCDDIDSDRLSVTETDLPGKRVITACTGGQVVAQFAVPAPAPEAALEGDAVTIGEALEAVASSPAGNKPVDRSNAAAVQAAEVRATGLGRVVPGGVAAAAQAAADSNARVVRDEEKVELSDVLTDATARLPTDKVVTREDAERVRAAEKRNSPQEEQEDEEVDVAAAVEAASRINQSKIV